LHDHGLAPEASVHELSSADLETLTSALVARLLAAGFPIERRSELVRSVPHSKAHDGLSLPRLVNLVSAAAREGEPGLGLALLLGDPEARRELEALETRYHQTIRTLLLEIQTNGVLTKRAIHVVPVAQVAYAGEVCGLAMDHVLARTHATLAFSEFGDQIRVSARGTPQLVEHGLDLGVALRAAATAVDGTGGGHNIAAGATVPRAGFDEFLSRVDDLVAAQIGA
jgi:RecJ-like exonuclease